jgi:hypothetical protein
MANLDGDNRAKRDITTRNQSRKSIRLHEPLSVPSAQPLEKHSTGQPIL